MNGTTLSQVDDDLPQHGVDAAPPNPPGYDLLGEVGCGGMGVVYRARDVALEREVAVKVLRDRFAPDSGAARRFVDEARITGQLQHPGIPAVYQVGALADGRPFLAMKLIKGRTLDESLKAGATLDPLAVFEAIGQAVGYAHAHGVIHRDLKPANVMVGAFGEVQVMDWGLAKVLASGGVRPRRPDDPEATAAQTEIKSLRDSDPAFTQAGSILGTPAFLPPEQAAGELDKIDTRSDVFGLGAILCVLLTGKPPFDGKDTESVRINAVRGKTEEAFARLDGCGADPDVVALCKRCLAFEPADRPATADEVASAVAALRRAADDRAKQAERDKLSAEVRTAELTKRRRAVLRAAGAAAAVLLLGVAGTTIGLIRTDAARRDAVQAREAESAQRQAAQSKEAEASAVVEFLEERVFAAARPKGVEGGLGKDVTLRDAIAASLPALDTVFADQPLVEARLRTKLGDTFYYLGDAQTAAEQHERARAIFAARRGLDHPDTLKSMSDLATAYETLGRHAEALRLNEEALAARQRVLGPDHRDTLWSMQSLASNYADVGRHADALKLHEEALAASRRVLGPDHRDTLWGMSNLAYSYAGVGRHADALKLREQVLAARRRVLPPDHPDVLASIRDLALSYASLDRPADALKLREEALAARRRLLGPEHPETLWSMHDLAASYASLGRHAEALKLYEEVLAARRRVLGPDHRDTLWGMSSVAASLVDLNRGAEAIPVIDECVARAAGKAIDPQILPAVLNLRLRHFQSVNDPAECRATAAMWEKLDRADADSLYVAACMRAVTAGLYAKANQPAEAAADADRAMAWLTKALAACPRPRARLETNGDLAALRGRADFRALLASLPELPRPVR